MFFCRGEDHGASGSDTELIVSDDEEATSSETEATGSEEEEEDEEELPLLPDEIDGIKFTAVPKGLFSHPAPTSRSGGTAAFFLTRYVGPQGPQRDKWGRSDSYWLAKDLERAVDELGFYELVGKLGPEYKLLHRWGMEYGGVLYARCQGSSPGKLEREPRKLMLLRNLRDGIKSLRMLDVKIGSTTAVAGWQGKSQAAATKQQLLDRVTNSSVQGFRLEGFDGPPEALATILQGEPSGCNSCLGKPGKKTKRFNLQRLVAPDFLLHWTDFAGLQPQEAKAAKKGTLLAIEYCEAVLFDAIGQLASMCVDAESMPVPQMWIGSSVAFACESAALPDRRRAAKTLQDHLNVQGGRFAASSTSARAMFTAASAAASALVGSRDVVGALLARVAVFDWGRSELNTAENHAKLSETQRSMREEYWRIWRRGPLKLLYDAMCLYDMQFRPASWVNGAPVEESVKFILWDEDTYDPCDIIGEATIPLRPTNGVVKLPIESTGMFGDKELSATVLEVEVAAAQVPAGSRFSQMWHVTVVRVSKLPKMDWFSDTDPRVQVIVSNGGNVNSGDGRQGFTRVIYNQHDAHFGTRLDFGFVRPDVYSSMFSVVSSRFGQEVNATMLPKNGEWKAAATPMEDPPFFDRFLAALRLFASLAEKS